MRLMSTLSFIADTKEDAAFRLEVRSWLEENLPPELQGLVHPPAAGDDPAVAAQAL